MLKMNLLVRLSQDIFKVPFLTYEVKMNIDPLSGTAVRINDMKQK